MAVDLQQYTEENLCFPMMSSSQLWVEPGGLGDFYHTLQQPQAAAAAVPPPAKQRNQALFCNGHVASAASDQATSLSALLEKQRLETDRFLALQSDRLRVALQEQRKQQLLSLVKRLEAKAVLVLRQKDEDIARETRKTLELEECLKRMESESQAWQRMAMEKESVAISLNNALEQITMEQACSSSPGTTADDCLSCCGHRLFPLPSRPDDVDGHVREKITCKACNLRESTVVILPCRHLCSCKACEPFLHTCPVCKSVKKSSIEVILF